MRLTSIKITQLFEIFDYDISFKNSENVLIITGPNGFGKTMVLNIIYNLFNRRFAFFQKLVFQQIIIYLNESISIVINKTIIDSKSHIGFSFFENNNEIETFEYSNKIETDIGRNIQRYLPVRRIEPDKWLDNRTGQILTIEDLINEYEEHLPEEVSKNLLKIKSKRSNEILDSIQVHLIREQRLFKKVQNTERSYREEKEESIMIETIQTYSKELKHLIAEFSQKSFFQTQELDSSYQID